MLGVGVRGGGQRGRRAAAALRSPYPAMTAGWQAQQGQSMGKDVLGSSSSSTAGRQAQQGQSMGRTCLAAAAAARLQLCCAAHRDAVDDELHVGGLQHSVKTQVDVASLPFPRGRRMGEEERGVSRETRWGKRAPRARVGGPRGCAPPPPSCQQHQRQRCCRGATAVAAPRPALHAHHCDAAVRDGGVGPPLCVGDDIRAGVVVGGRDDGLHRGASRVVHAPVQALDPNKDEAHDNDWRARAVCVGGRKGGWGGGAVSARLRRVGGGGKRLPPTQHARTHAPTIDAMPPIHQKLI